MTIETRHYPALDALRGIAALTVVITHILTSVRGSAFWPWIPSLDASAISPMTYGVSPVMLFFVLSGFVLSLSLERSFLKAAPAFVIRRIARIWLPYVAALVVFVIASGATMSIHEDMYPSSAASFRAPFDAADFAQHLMLIFGSYPIRYLGVSWTLVHEMRISLVFPLVVLALWSRPWYVMVVIGFGICALGQTLLSRAGLDQYTTDWRNTIYCSGMFIQGMMIAKYRARIAGALSGASRPARWALIAAAVSLYVGGVWDIAIHGIKWFPIGIMVGCCLLVALGITSSGRNPIVHSRPAQWLGKVSYSLYLVHPTMLVLCFRLLHTKPPIVIALAVIVGSFILADISYRLIEKPSMALGKLLSDALRSPRSVAA